jgi:hypothetical protein
MQNLVRQHLLRAQDRMKWQADKGRSERVFQVGDRVFLKLQPYVQSSLAPRANQKLAFKCFVGDMGELGSSSSEVSAGCDLGTSRLSRAGEC